MDSEPSKNFAGAAGVVVDVEAGVIVDVELVE